MSDIIISEAIRAILDSLTIDDFAPLFEDFEWLNKTYATEKNNLEFVEKGSDLNEVHEVTVKVVNNLTVDQMRYTMVNTVKRQVQDQVRDLLRSGKEKLYEVYPQGSKTEFDASSLQPQKKAKDPDAKAHKAVKEMSEAGREKLLAQLLAEKAAAEKA